MKNGQFFPTKALSTPNYGRFEPKILLHQPRIDVETDSWACPVGVGMISRSPKFPSQGAIPIFDSSYESYLYTTKIDFWKGRPPASVFINENPNYGASFQNAIISSA